MDSAELDIQSGDYNLVSRILYGGLCSGAIVIPTNFIKVILTLIFPPLGTILQVIGNGLLTKFPYITWDTLLKLFDLKNFNTIIYTFILTSLFYVPGLIYALSLLNPGGNRGYQVFNPDTGAVLPIDASGNPIVPIDTTPAYDGPIPTN
jgi:uncharacterized membrane protein YqaE (UPF0057 family)